MKTLISFFAFALLTGCASVTGSSMQPMSVAAICDDGKVVKDALCTLMNDKGQWFITSPGSTMIQKSYGDLSVSCKKGDSTGLIIMSSKSNANVWGNILAGGLIGYAVDANSGAGFNYQNMIAVPMSKPCS